MAAWNARLQSLFAPHSREIVRVRVDCKPVERGRVDAGFEMWIEAPVDEVWSRAADLPRFLTIDPFHREIIVSGPSDRPGTAIEIVHGLIGIRFSRYGRLLAFREGSGFAFSDLSARGPRRGFPHVFIFEVEPLSDGPRPWTRLSVRVRGKWTARWLPGWTVRWWITAVCREHARLLAKAFSGEREAM